MSVSRQEALTAVRTLLAYIGENPDREGLRDTPRRVIQSWEREWGAGYREPNFTPSDFDKMFHILLSEVYTANSEEGSA